MLLPSNDNDNKAINLAIRDVSFQIPITPLLACNI